MRILFVSSGNSKQGISPIVKKQGESLKRAGVDISYYPIIGKGFFGYLKGAIKLREYVKRYKFDIIHAHYSLTAIISTLSGSVPIVVSLMGSDIEEFWWSRSGVKIFNILFWDACIVKSERLKRKLNLKNLIIIPNGVDIDVFRPFDKRLVQRELKWDSGIKHILFPANPAREEKNYRLFQKSLNNLSDSIKYDVHILNEVSPEMTPKYYNASDVVVLTSIWEGSPNVIKEAMACNTPIITTDVGDVRWVLGNTEGCFITSFDALDISDKIIFALKFAEIQGKTKGRDRIIELGLDAESIAKKIINVYEKVLNG